jgi:hypothetical protein
MKIKSFQVFAKKKKKILKSISGLLFVFFFVLFKADVTGRAEFSRRHHNHFLFCFFHETLREKVPGILYFLLAPTKKNKYMPRYSIVIRVMETGAVCLAPSPEW